MKCKKQKFGIVLVGVMAMLMNLVAVEGGVQEKNDKPLVAWDLLSDELKERNLNRLFVLYLMFNNQIENFLKQNNSTQYRIRAGLGPALQHEDYSNDYLNRLIKQLRTNIGDLRCADLWAAGLESLEPGQQRRRTQTEEIKDTISDIQEIIGVLEHYRDNSPGPWRQTIVYPEYKRALNPE